LLDEVERGRTVRITRHGKTIARVVPEAEVRAAEVEEAINRPRPLRANLGKAPLAENSGKPPPWTQVLSFVIDASILAAWFLGEESDPRVEAAIDALTHIEARAPNLLFYEIRNMLLLSERRRRTAEAVADPFLRDFAQLRIRAESPREDISLMTLARARHLYLRRRLSRACQACGAAAGDPRSRP
jgi:predicted nucleic acid-binding protein